MRFVIERAEDPTSLASVTERLEVYNDVLIPPFLDLEDGYKSLVPKTKRRLHVVRLHSISLGVLRHALRRRRARGRRPATRGYGIGLAPFASILCEPSLSRALPETPTLPQRSTTHRNYLPEAVYPMSQLPPFAIGPHYLLSMDCAEFIHKNKDDLAGVGTLGRVSVALWLLALQVHPPAQ